MCLEGTGEKELPLGISKIEVINEVKNVSIGKTEDFYVGVSYLLIGWDPNEKKDEFDSPEVLALLELSAHERTQYEKESSVETEKSSRTALRKKRHKLLEERLQQRLYYDRRNRMSVRADKAIHYRRMADGISEDSNTEQEDSGIEDWYCEDCTCGITTSKGDQE